MSKKVYEIIQKKFVDQIQKVIDGETNLLPWQKPWKGSPPRNYDTGRRYSGINLFLLDGGEWLTFNQIKKHSEKNPDVKLRKGSKGSMIVFWKMAEKKDSTKEKKEYYPMLRYYYVYNVSDVNGLESKLPPGGNSDPLIEEAEKVVNEYIERTNLDLDTVKGSRKAYYQPASDRVVLPAKEDFHSGDHYYQTLFHELSHSTGVEGRCNRFKRDDSVLFGSEVYSKEELVAELSSQMLMGMLNIQNAAVEENSLSYAYGWMKAIKEDARLIVSASAQAQKACDYILGGDSDEEPETDE